MVAPVLAETVGAGLWVAPSELWGGTDSASTPDDAPATAVAGSSEGPVPGCKPAITADSVACMLLPVSAAAGCCGCCGVHDSGFTIVLACGTCSALPLLVAVGSDGLAVAACPCARACACACLCVDIRRELTAVCRYGARVCSCSCVHRTALPLLGAPLDSPELPEVLCSSLKRFCSIWRPPGGHGHFRVSAPAHGHSHLLTCMPSIAFDFSPRCKHSHAQTRNDASGLGLRLLSCPDGSSA